MPRLYLICFLVFCAHFSNLLGQTELKQILKFADEQYQKGDYYYAKEYYEKAMTYDSSSVSILWGYAETLRAYQDYKNAATYYQLILEKEDTKIYPLSALYLGLMQQQNGDYNAALETFKYAKKKYARDKRNYPYLKARQSIKACIWARDNVRDTQEVLFEKLPPTVNSKNAEFGHTIRGNELIFSSLRADSTHENEEIYEKEYHTHLYSSKRITSDWDTSKAIKSLFTPKLNTGNGSFSLDGKRFYYSLCTEKSANYSCKIMVANYENGAWKNSDSLGSIINEFGANTTQPYIGSVNGEEWLFFSSDREDGEGGMDLFYSKITNGNQYGKVKNLKSINSIGNEITPFWDTTSNKLYFSSDWYEGFGGFDIFSSQLNENFETPINSGIPANSPANDLYYFTQADTSYVSSNRKGVYFSKNPTCCSDIFSLKPIPVPIVETPQETLEELNARLPVRLYFHNDIPDPRSWDTLTNVNYQASYNDYVKLLPTYQKEYGKGLSGQNAQDAAEDIEDFFLEYVQKGMSDLELFRDLLLKELQKGAKINISIKGFASPLAKTDYNVNLTKRRITSLKNYLGEWDNGVFLPFIKGTAENGALLTFTQIPFGEYTANRLISDNINDLKNSVYSRVAALERKIEIQSVSYIEAKDSLTSALKANKEIIDLGKISSEKEVFATFYLSNTLSDTITIVGIENTCSCVTTAVNYPVLLPHTQSILTFYFNPKEYSGKTVKSIVVKTDVGQELRLIISAEVE